MQRHSLSGIAAVCGLLAGVTTAQAGVESWVSGSGSDVGTCPVTAPCRTFAFAHGQTTAHGAINVLTSGNFGPVTITKAMSIVADGVEAVINTAAGGAGIIVQVPATAIVSLRGLTIDMRGTANDGISFVSGAALHVQDTVIRKVATGIRFEPASGAPELYVADSVIANALNNGITVFPTGSAGPAVVLDRVRVENGVDVGILIVGNNTSGSIRATVRESVVSGNGTSGISVADSGSGTTSVTIDQSAIVNNGDGIVATAAGAIVRLGDSTVTGNALSAFFSCCGGDLGTIASYGTNKVNGNGGNETPTGTIPTK